MRVYFSDDEFDIFFFFQAEDGIRDVAVTGVQTCALPIYVGKRLVKSPKVHVRDSGLTHALLGLTNKELLLGHPVVGQSWESFVIETLIAAAPQSTEASFYRTSAGAKIDLVLTLPGGQLWAIEIKRSSAPTLEKGFHFACADLKPKQRFVVYPGHERFSLDSVTEAIGLRKLAQVLQAVR